MALSSCLEVRPVTGAALIGRVYGRFLKKAIYKKSGLKSRRFNPGDPGC